MADSEIFEGRGYDARQITAWPNAAPIYGAVGFVFLEIYIEKRLTRIFRIADDGRGRWVRERAAAAVR
jgi:hypothetical protein